MTTSELVIGNIYSLDTRTWPHVRNRQILAGAHVRCTEKGYTSASFEVISCPHREQWVQKVGRHDVWLSDGGLLSESVREVIPQEEWNPQKVLDAFERGQRGEP